MTDFREPEAAPQFSQPVRQIVSMLIASALVGAGLYVGFNQIRAIFLSNPYLNGAIFAVFVLGVLSCFGQVAQLMRSVKWIEAFASRRLGSNLIQAPSLLAPLATLLRSRGARMQISAGSSRSILESVAQRIDEDRDLTRYIGNTLIFLGLLGTFYGLATTVPALVETIRSLNAAEGESGADVFGRLQAGLESQLGGMGTAFSSSLLGLAGSLVVGLLELFASHGQNRFYRELEEWLSTITRLGFASGEEGASADNEAINSFMDHIADQMEEMQALLTRTTEQSAMLDNRLSVLASVLGRLADGDGGAAQTVLLSRIAESQEAIATQLAESAGDGLDAESRMRLRSIDVQMLRLLEEITAGRQESTMQLRNELSALTRALRANLSQPSEG